MKHKSQRRYKFSKSSLNNRIIFIGIALAFLEISWWFSFSNVGNPVLYTLLITGEVFYLLMTFGYWYTVWETPFIKSLPVHTYPTIDVIIPVCGEPLKVIEETIRCVLNMKYKDKTVKDYTNEVKLYILNDGFIQKRHNWKEIVWLKFKYPLYVITRVIPGGAKAGNINQALPQTHGEFIMILDSDQKPYSDFLTKTLGFFIDKKLAFVQTPQYYENFNDNYVTSGAWAQQELFFGPICRGKNRLNAAFCCGTNVIFRRKALEEVGGFDTTNIAEDFAATVNIHNKGWKSLYYQRVLAAGMAPHDLGSYYSQQIRWAKGSLDVLFKNNPILKPNLSTAQKIQYLLSLGFYMTGIFILIDALTPIIYLLTGALPVKGSSVTYMLLFFPYMFIIINILSSSTNGRLTYKALQFSVGAFYIQIIALISSLLNIKTSFKITSKKKEEDRNYAKLVWPHISYIILSIVATWIGIEREGISPAFVTNLSWVVFNCVMFSAYIYAAFPYLHNLRNKFNLYNIIPNESASEGLILEN